MKVEIKNCRPLGILILALTVLSIGLTVENTFAANTTINPGSDTIVTGLKNVNSGETLTLNPGTYTGNNQQGNTGIQVDKNVTFKGNGSTGSVIIDGQRSHKLLTITANNINVTFINITFKGGLFNSHGGGAVENQNANSVMTFINCEFINNPATIELFYPTLSVSKLSDDLTVFSEDVESGILSDDLTVFSEDLESTGSILASIPFKSISYVSELEWRFLTLMFNISLFSVLLYFIWCGILLLFPIRNIKHEYMGIKEYKLYVMVPSLNEKNVIENTVRRFFENNSENFSLIVIDDGSDDGTGEILEKIAPHYDNLHIISRTLPNARKGKGDALNEGLAYIRKLEGSNSEKVIIGVIDADAYIKNQDYIKVVSVFNGSHDIAMVQTAVGMNSVDTWLHRMQDLEFQSCITIISNLRNYLGNAAGGGNGQFFRLSGFGNKTVVWGNSLLEDFEVSTRILLEGNKTCFLENVVVYQEPVGKIKPLITQRTRWAQGGIECISKYGKQILKSKCIRNTAKFEMFFYMFLPFFTAIGVIGHAFSFWYHCFLVLVLKQYVNIELIILLAISIIIAIVFGIIYGSRTKYGMFRGFFIGATIPVYSILMIPVCYRSIIRFLKNDKQWDKTDHVMKVALSQEL